MPDQELVRVARRFFNPYAPESGTEQMAAVLHGLTRMTRPRTVVERGSGYTTLFLLSALAENADDFEAEAEALRTKTAAVGDLAAFELGIGHPAIAAWYRDGGQACAVDPGFYLRPHAPRLYSFEAHGEPHPYAGKMIEAVAELKLGSFITHLWGAPCSASALPQHALPVDLAWNDDDQYEEFFEEFWPVLNPQGGLMLFHNTAAVRRWWNSIAWMKQARSSAGDLEVLTLAEGHKLNQNSCTILRRTTDYHPAYLNQTPERVAADVKRFMALDPQL